MPALSPTMSDGQIVQWHKKEGDLIAPGDVLFEVQTDKAVMAFEIEEEGILAKILPNVEDTTTPVPVGQLVAVMVEPGEDWQNVTVPSSTATASPASPATSTVTSETVAAAPVAQQHHEIPEGLKMGPAASRLVHSFNVDTTKIKGSGPQGRILKNDVLDFISANNLTMVDVKPSASASASAKAPSPTPTPVRVASTPAPVAPTTSSEGNELDYEDIEISSMRKIIAKRLVFSKTTVPHSYVKSVCHVDKLLRLRADLMKNEQKKVSLNDFIIKALALALRIVPELNSNYDEKTDSFTPLAGVDVSIAVATDKGLITPIVKDADRLGVLDISSRVKELAGRARANKLQPHEFQGGGFSISNLGMFGITDFTAVINPPQVGILAVGTSKRKLNVEDLTGAPVTEVSFNLSFDERCVSMDRAIKFLNTLSYFIANPDLLADEVEQF